MTRARNNESKKMHENLEKQENRQKKSINIKKKRKSVIQKSQ